MLRVWDNLVLRLYGSTPRRWGFGFECVSRETKPVVLFGGSETNASPQDTILHCTYTPKHYNPLS